MRMALEDTAFLDDSPDQEARRARKKRRREKLRRQQEQEEAAARAQAEAAAEVSLQLGQFEDGAVILDDLPMPPKNSLVMGFEMWLHQMRHENIKGVFDEDAEVDVPMATRIDEQIEALKEAYIFCFESLLIQCFFRIVNLNLFQIVIKSCEK